MNTAYVAGAIFTLQQTIFIQTGAVLIIGVALGLIVYVVQRLLHRHGARTPRFLMSLLIGIALITALVVAIFVIPTFIRDARARDKANMCAKQIGYSSPADDDNPRVYTGETQAAYRQCLGLE